VNSKNDYRFKSLFRAFIAHKLAEVVLISNWLIYLKAHPYNAEVEVLSGM
jgi:hypothetical protein